MNYEIIRLYLENEMDVVLAHKRSIGIGGLLDLPISSQTSFTTAISECCREVIERTQTGLLIFQITKEADRFYLTALIRYVDTADGNHKAREMAFDYAKRLVSQFNTYAEGSFTIVELKINIPGGVRPSEEKIMRIKDHFKNQHPSSPYEQVKRKKDELDRIAAEQEEQLIRSKYINEKKTEFLSIASHELKTPLTTIKAFAQLALADGGNCSENVRMYLSKINSQSDKLYKLIQQLLDVSKVESGQLTFTMEEVAMNGFIHDTVSLVSKTIPAHNIVLQLQDDTIAKIDKLRLEQVFSNILVNAAKYSKEDTRIIVSASLDPGNMLRISIEDQGIGMSGTNLEKVFEKFFRVEETAKNYPGLGMGLYIASKIVAGHGGKMWLESQLGKGSVFHFSLPFLSVMRSVSSTQA